MAGILSVVSWIFCFRPITWLLSKIIWNKKVLGFILELFYLGLSILYTVFAGVMIMGVVGGGLTTVEGGSFFGMIILIAISIIALLSLGYGIMKYHKTDEDMSEFSNDGYEGTYDFRDDTIYVREKTKESLSYEAFWAVVTAPLQILIRAINFILVFRCFFNDDYVCDLAYSYHPDLDGVLKKIFIDIVDVSRL